MVPCLQLLFGTEKNYVNLSQGSNSKSGGTMNEDYPKTVEPPFKVYLGDGIFVP
jgi:hypothetical protein